MTFLSNYVAAIQLKTSYWLLPFILKEIYQKTDEVTRLLEGFRNHLRGGVHPDYFVKLDFEIAVDQQTKAHDRTFEGVPDSG